MFFHSSKNSNFHFAHGQNKTENIRDNKIRLQHKVLKIHVLCPSLKQERKKTKNNFTPIDGRCFLFTISDYTTLTILLSLSHRATCSSHPSFLHSAIMYLISFNQLPSAPKEAPGVERYNFPQKKISRYPRKRVSSGYVSTFLFWSVTRGSQNYM